MLPESIKNEITEILKPLNPSRVILFGSYAWGQPQKDSDIDLYIVTSDTFIPENFSKQSELYIKYADSLDSLYKNYAIDLIVHTRPMSDEFLKNDSMFSRKILKDGIVLL